MLVVPVLATVAAFRGYMEQREQREHVEFLYESMRATQGAPEFGLAVGQLLVAARRLLRAEYAEILLLPPSDEGGPLRSVSGAEGELLMHPEERFSPEDAAAFSEVASIGSATLLTRRRAIHAFDAFLHRAGSRTRSSRRYAARTGRSDCSSSASASATSARSTRPTSSCS